MIALNMHAYFIREFPQFVGSICQMNIPYSFIYYPKDIHVLH
jgi:hypothetical protein